MVTCIRIRIHQKQEDRLKLSSIVFLRFCFYKNTYVTNVTIYELVWNKSLDAIGIVVLWSSEDINMHKQPEISSSSLIVSHFVANTSKMSNYILMYNTWCWWLLLSQEAIERGEATHKLLGSTREGRRLRPLGEVHWGYDSTSAWHSGISKTALDKNLIPSDFDFCCFSMCFFAGIYRICAFYFTVSWNHVGT